MPASITRILRFCLSSLVYDAYFYNLGDFGWHGSACNAYIHKQSAWESFVKAVRHVMPTSTTKVPRGDHGLAFVVWLDVHSWEEL